MAIQPLKPTTLPPNTVWQQVSLQEQTISFMLKRSQRKSIGLRISDEGLIITAPVWASQNQIHDALTSKANWILQKLQDLEQRLAQQAMSQTVWQADGQLPYLGTLIRLQLNPLLSQTLFTGDLTAPQDADRLCLQLAPDADSQRVQDLCHVWLQKQAHYYLDLRLRYFLKHTDYQERLKNWRLASPAKRWGSCSSLGTIMLNWRLIHFKPAIIDYVVAHEVAHLKHMDHSAAFWQEVERLLPDFYTARQQLKQFDPASLPLF